MFVNVAQYNNVQSRGISEIEQTEFFEKIRAERQENTINVT